MSAVIHPSALVDASAELGSDVVIGPWAIVGPGCVVGDGSVIAARATLERNVRLGRSVRVGVGTILGGDPQDLKWRGEETSVEVGDRTVFREYVTVNRGTSHSWRTVVGEDCFLMSYSHLAHDCMVGNGVIISNASQFAGHVIVEDKVTVSGVCAFHQFVRVGKHCFIGGHSRVTQDVPPFVKAVGNPVKLYGLNTIGLERSGFPAELLTQLKRAYRACFNSDMHLTKAIATLRSGGALVAEVEHMLRFIEASERGVVT